MPTHNPQRYARSSSAPSGPEMKSLGRTTCDSFDQMHSKARVATPPLVAPTPPGSKPGLEQASFPMRAVTSLADTVARTILDDAIESVSGIRAGAQGVDKVESNSLNQCLGLVLRIGFELGYRQETLGRLSLRLLWFGLRRRTFADPLVRRSDHAAYWGPKQHINQGQRQQQPELKGMITSRLPISIWLRVQA